MVNDLPCNGPHAVIITNLHCHLRVGFREEHFHYCTKIPLPQMTLHLQLISIEFVLLQRVNTINNNNTLALVNSSSCICMSEIFIIGNGGSGGWAVRRSLMMVFFDWRVDHGER